MPSTSPLAPKLLKGALVRIDETGIGRVPQIIAFQYTPETLSRKLKRAEKKDDREASKPPNPGATVQPSDPEEEFDLTLELDATDDLEEPLTHPTAALVGRTLAVAYTPEQFLRRLAALVPPPRWHQTRYFGVFAPASALRARVVSAEGKGSRRRACSAAAACQAPAGEQLGLELEQGMAEELGLGFDPLEWGPPPMPWRERRLDWAQLLKRVFEAQVLRCTRCGGRRRVTAFVSDAVVARQVLEGLGMASEPLQLARARAPPRQESFELPADDPGIDPQYPD